MAKIRVEKSNIIKENGEKYTVVKLSDDKDLKVRHPKGRDLRFT